jgi:DNA-binding transcriptional LysR family regulator
MAHCEAVVAGIGIGMSPLWAFRKELQTQSVKIILADYEPDPLPIQAIYRRTRFQSAKVRCFIDFLMDEFKTGLLQ